MDARHPLKDLDRRMLDYFTPPAGRCIFYCPKPTNSRQEQATTLRKVKAELAQYGDTVSVQLFSSLKNRAWTPSSQAVQTWFDAVDAAEVGAVDADDTAADDKSRFH